MPKIVDHDERRRSLLDALWRLAEKDEPFEPSIRKLAAEAGVSKSNVSHYFTTRADLLTAAVDDIVAGATGTATRLLSDAPGHDDFVVTVLSLLPLTPLERRRARVWRLLISERSDIDDEQDLLARFNEHVQRGLRRMLELMKARGLVRADLDLDLESNRLQALIDGLSLRLLSSGDHLDHGTVRRIVDEHLRSLATD